MAVSAGRSDGGQEAWSSGRQRGSQGPLGRRYPKGGGQMGSGMRVFSDRWMAVTLISPPPASRWPLPPPLPLKGHLHMALLPPGSHPIIYTPYAHTLVLTHRHQWFSYCTTLSQPQHLGTGRVNSRAQG